MSQNTTVDTFTIDVKCNTESLNQLESQLKRIAEQLDLIGSDTQQDTKRPKVFNYWKIEVIVEGLDGPIIGYGKRDGQFDYGEYIRMFQNTSDPDFITVPSSRVIAVKYYAVTE
ncbi:hypothetical protein [Xenorhabdus stockiae]|uniref:hypothetical protein n=1 Tax=Xenorhabdus stockiae TaxID=351614 RepID=UPI0040639918